MMLAAKATCAAHPGNEAVAICARCGGFVCERCSNPGAGSQRLCDGCIDRGALQATARSKLALGLATCSFVLVLPGIAALMLARAELRDVRDGKILPTGVMFARLAQWIALLELASLGLG